MSDCNGNKIASKDMCSALAGGSGDGMSESASGDGIKQGNLLDEGPRVEYARADCENRASNVEKVLALYPIVRDTLDPDVSSVYMNAIRNALQHYALAALEVYDESSALKVINRKDMTEEEGKTVTTMLEAWERLDAWARCLKEALHCLKGCHETMGLTPHQLAELAKCYDIDDQIPSWYMVEKIQEKVLMARMRSVNALPRDPRVSDGRILEVVACFKGREAQAKELGFKAGSCVSRRLRQMSKKGIDVDLEVEKLKPRLGRSKEKMA